MLTLFCLCFISGCFALPLTACVIYTEPTGNSQNSGQANNSNQNTHTHLYGDWFIDEEPTCILSGVQHRSCYCGSRQTETIDALGHYYVNGICRRCSVPQPTISALKFRLKRDNTYEVYCADKTVKNVAIPSMYNNKAITSIGESAFAECDMLESVYIPESVTSIGNSAFYCCISLTTINIPNNVTYIGTKALAYCISVTSISIPDSVTMIDEGTFEGCILLARVKIPKNLTSIGHKAFSQCLLLRPITIPYKVNYIGSNAFENCALLSSVSFENAEGWNCGGYRLSYNSLKNPISAAEYLTGTYCDRIWTRM